MTHAKHTRTTRSRTGAVAVMAVAGLVGAGLAAVPGTALAIAGSTFESTDGNLVFDSLAGKAHDWANVPGLRKAIDVTPKALDNSLGQGSKDDLSTVSVGTGSIPTNKSDLTRFYVANDQVGSQQYLYLAWERANTLGTANFSFELNQAAQPDLSQAGSVTLNRRAGDVLITYDFAKGGKAPVIGLSRWVVSGVAKRVCQANSSVPCWGKVKVLSSIGYADGAINAGKTVIDPIAPDAPRALGDSQFGEAAINMTAAQILNGCLGFSSAWVRSRASAAFDSELKDFIAPFGINLAVAYDPSGSQADSVDPADGHGALAVRVQQAGGNVVDLPAGTTVSSQTGPGSSSSDHSEQALALPEDGSVVRANLLHESSLSTVDGPASAAAEQLTAASVADLDVLEGTVTADAVSAVAQAFASPNGASVSTLGTGLANVWVDKDGNGLLQQPARVTVFNEPIGLSASRFGNGSYVAFFQKANDSSAPPLGTPAGSTGTYEAHQSVTVLRVHITDLNPLPGVAEPIDIWVSKAYAHARYSGLLCTAPQRVSGNAALVSVDTPVVSTDPDLGFVRIPATGGQDTASIVSADVEGLVTAGVGDTATAGGFDATQASAGSHAQLADVCVAPDPLGGCLVSAQLVRSEASALADASGASADGDGTTIVGLVVAGEVVDTGSLPANFVLDLVGGFVVVNEQFCDTGTAAGCASGPSAGITVRALHVVIPGVLDVVVGEAHADATFVSA